MDGRLGAPCWAAWSKQVFSRTEEELHEGRWGSTWGERVCEMRPQTHLLLLMSPGAVSLLPSWHFLRLQEHTDS